jgi:hypothetical protein
MSPAVYSQVVLQPGFPDGNRQERRDAAPPNGGKAENLIYVKGYFQPTGYVS